MQRGNDYNNPTPSYRAEFLDPRPTSAVAQRYTSPGRDESFPQAELPSYELPPEYVPPHVRLQHPDYRCDVRSFQNRRVRLQRARLSDQLGFNVRGGADHKCGIFISKVSRGSDAERLGLQEGDQILFANGESFLHLDHSEAVSLLKRYADVELVVKYFPYGYNKSFDKCKAIISPGISVAPPPYSY